MVAGIMEDTMGDIMDQETRMVKIITILGICVLSIKPALAGEWDIQPNLILKETYTDNLLRASKNLEKDEYVTEVNPGISVHGKGRRASINADYSMQNLLYARESGRNKINHRLTADANTEIVREHFFMDGAASIMQQLITPDAGLKVDNLNPGNRTDISTLKLSPYYSHNYRGYVDANVRYTYDGIRIDQGGSDSDGNRVNVNLSSGKKFTRLIWDFSYRDETIDRETTTNIQRESTLGNLRYLLGQGFSFVAKAGNERNDYRVSRRTLVNGSYWAAGMGWQPGREFSIDVMQGNNFRSASVNINPTSRTSLQAAWSDSEVGTNVGEVWSGSFSLRTKRSAWQASYSENTTSFQQLLSLFAYYDPDTGERILNPANGQNVVVKRVGSPDSLRQVIFIDNGGNLFGSFFGIFDDIFISKRGQVSVSYQTGKSTFLLSLYNEKRVLESSTDDQVINGANISWNWRFASRTSLKLSAQERKLDFQSSTREDTLSIYEARLEKKINPKTDASVSYRLATLDSTNAISEYDENRLVLSLNMRF